MARSRNIKPGFFTNDVLGELPALTRLLFAGIWTICDREGRLEDRPKKIRAEILPYDQCDADEMLNALDKAGFIKRYEVDGIKVIQVLAWALHQNPHIKEAPSTLPVYVEHQTSTIQEQCLEQPLPERAGLIPSLLIPDSLNLVPDSLVTQDKPAKQAKRRSQIPNDFYPNDDNLFAFNKTRLNLGEEIGKFMDHHQAKGSLMADWQAAWRTWVSNGVKFAAKGKPAESFKERDDRNARKRWEEMTGQTHPDNMKNIFARSVNTDNLLLEVTP